MRKLITQMQRTIKNAHHVLYTSTTGDRVYSLLVPIEDGWEADTITVTIEDAEKKEGYA